MVACGAPEPSPPSLVVYPSSDPVVIPALGILPRAELKFYQQTVHLLNWLRTGCTSIKLNGKDSVFLIFVLVAMPQVDLSQPRVPDSQPASQELSRPPQEPESTNSNYNGIEVPGKNAMNPKGPEDGKKMNKLDERVEPPVKTITPISGPPPKLSYAQVARMKQVQFSTKYYALYQCDKHSLLIVRVML